MRLIAMIGISACLVAATPATAASTRDYPIKPVPFTDVKIADEFWSARQETSRRVTIPYCFKKCEETGRISNFAKAAGLMPGKFEGIYFNDSDVYKVIEGAAYSLAVHPDPKLDKYLDDLIAKIAAAQRPDGYLNTYHTLVAPDKRWSNVRSQHELYCAGHLFEAAVAHYLATNKRTLLNVAIKLADYIDSVFGPGKRHDVPGHEEIEIGLVKLYRVTRDERYLKLAKFFIDERGHPHGRKLYGAYAQDHKPVVEQDEPVGHAVRAGYLYSGMADVAALTGDTAYVAALDKIWNDTVLHKQYITGGVGSSRSGEAFGKAYELPNATAYNETCAAVANMLWNHRMFLLEGESKYIDVLERVLYNGFLSGVSLSGDRFFYPNPLASDGVTRFNQGAATRKGWFGCSCCPVNVARVVPSLAGYVYAQRNGAIYVNLFAAGTGTIEIKGQALKITQKTRYPWDGRVKIAVETPRPVEFDLMVRIPGWASGLPWPSDLYRPLEKTKQKVSLKLNGRSIDLVGGNGYARISRVWKKGDTVELNLPMPIRRVVAHPKVKEDAGRVALMRGPIVYCLEAADNGGQIRYLAIEDNAKLTAEYRPDLLGGVTVIRGMALAKARNEKDKSVVVKPVPFTAIPYYAWSNRGPGEMEVWVPRDPAMVEAPPLPTLASAGRPSASHVWSADTVKALNDRREPKRSNDHSIPRFTWWDHRGTTEWVQYDFKKPTKVSGVEVYWFDDTGNGGCRVPKSWRILYRAGGEWKPVTGAGLCGCERDRFNRVEFDPVETDGLRLEVRLQPKFSGGILEWRVIGEAS